jgi:hypothetical protein
VYAWFSPRKCKEKLALFRAESLRGKLRLSLPPFCFPVLACDVRMPMGYLEKHCLPLREFVLFLNLFHDFPFKILRGDLTISVYGTHTLLFRQNSHAANPIENCLVTIRPYGNLL